MITHEERKEGSLYVFVQTQTVNVHGYILFAWIHSYAYDNIVGLVCGTVACMRYSIFQFLQNSRGFGLESFSEMSKFITWHMAYF